MTAPPGTDRSTWPDALALCVGTFTVIPVAPPRHVDKRAAGRSLALSVVVGALIGTAMWGIAAGAERIWASSFIAALAAITFSTAISRALHLDGLVDTVDGLGSGRRGDAGLDVMRRGDIGPFGVITLLIALLTQIGCLTLLIHSGLTWTLVIIVAASRASALLACRRDVPAARPDGLGAAVASSVPASTWWVIAAILVVTALATEFASGASTQIAGSDSIRLAAALIVGWLGAWWIVRRCVSRFGGITGDVIGACIEVSFTLALLVAAASML